MNRRDFLRLSMAAAALTGAGCGGGFDAPPVENHNPRFPALNFITRDPDFSDYRPAVDVTGERAIFERTPAGGGDTKLFEATPISSSEPTVTRFLPLPGRTEGVNIPVSQTRPDWCWQTGQVALNGAMTNSEAPYVVICGNDGSNPQEVPNTRGFNYPTWVPDGSALIVMNDSAGASPQPCSSLMLPDGTITVPNMNGVDADGVAVFGGFACPNPLDPQVVVFAGQPTLAVWGPTGAPGCESQASGYNQCFNYPFLSRFENGAFISRPIEARASIAVYDADFQGRAPSFSPNGRYVAFEADRTGGYAIFLADLVRGTVVQVTDSSFQAQHAKFFPDGDRLILTCLQSPEVSVRGIAWIDVSGFLG